MKLIEITVNDHNEDNQLRAIPVEYEYAIVTRAGHSFLDKELFIKELENKRFFIIGHVLDRELVKGYYELHVQCYVIHLPTYRELGCPSIGQQQFHAPHIQVSPKRSDENYHDDYTPWWVESGTSKRQYEHKAHGWNVLSIAFEKKLPVLVFNSAMRKTKEFNYEINR